MMRKTAIITGAAKGIGREIAKKFAYEDYNVLINYRTSEKEANKIKEELIKEECNVEIFKADVTKREEVDKMIEFCLLKFGSVDVIVNNAGICEYKLFIDIKEDDLRKMFEVTLLGAFNLIQSALKKYMLKNQNGCIINISSIWGVTGASVESNYSTMKAGLNGMTKALAKELGPSNIRVNAITPGIIDTEMNDHLSLEEKQSFVNDLPIEKMGSVSDVANLAVFLASEKASYITGAIIPVDGGATI